MKRSGVTPLLLIVFLSLGAVVLSVVVGNTPQLGLDLQGGFSVVLQAKPVNGKVPSDESVEKAKDIIAQRVDGLGVAEPDITRQGKTVIVQLPGVKNRKKAQSLVGCTAKLEFRPVLARGSTKPPPTTGKKPTATSAPEASSTTVAPGAGPATTPSTTPTTAAGKGQSGLGAVGISEGESAAALQLLPTTTTRPPTSTAPPTTAGPTTTTAVTPPTTAGPKTTLPKSAAATTTSCTEPGSSSSGTTPTTTLGQKPTDAGIFPGDTPDVIYQLGPVGFQGDALSSATARLGSSGEWEVNVAVKGKRQVQANALFNACYNAAATCPPSGGQRGATAIVLDGKVLSAPEVNGTDLASGASGFQISGSFTATRAKDLALVLRYGALPVEFRQVALQQVSATLGQDSLHAGLVAGVVGLALVAAYMLLYYRGLGLVVILGLSVWGGLMYAIVCYLSATQGLALTLAGITGIIVSVGTTVDSYVVFFERLKDEVRSGKTVRSSTERGFQRAFRTILTADVSSFIGASLLWWLTVGPVRGFAFFLGLSTVLDVLVAYFFTRPVVMLLGRNDFFTEARFFGIARGLGREELAIEALR